MRFGSGNVDSSIRLEFMIRTAFKLPFTAIHPIGVGYFQGELIRIVLEFAGSPTPTQMKLADSLLHLFCNYSATGALSGREIPPQWSGVEWTKVEMRSLTERVYELRNCRIDDTAVVLLCDLLLRESSSLSLAACVVSNGGEGVKLLQEPEMWSTYPPRFEALPFGFEDLRPESGAYTFVLELAEPLESTARQTLESQLNLWLLCVMAGGYALAPIEPKFNYVEPYDSIVAFQATIEWTIFKLRAHPAAIDALVNIFSKFGQEIQRVTIE